ncbi:hypothetical protein [Saccharopolyspora spinosa]|uniref:hypothetical protein n=1 Tax=Saccharopolyspora spinosa TaxID=60894 RepID=UPI00376EE3C1
MEALAEQGPLTEGRRRSWRSFGRRRSRSRKRERDAGRYRARRLLLIVLRCWRRWRSRGPLTVEQEAELAELRPKAHQFQKEKEGDAEHYRSGKAAADRFVELEALKERGPLTEEQEAELAELRPKARQFQKQKEKDAARSPGGKGCCRSCCGVGGVGGAGAAD